ncbi:hypothetical protein Nos7524_3587 [Nostoc sp. PCC 7524]|uniref:hypothetical protein n=1 Tax=Nostoc sp. (strain ATCC 29411 / PCC 7524) TaxID=28072 RepID=UPI00029F0765|nr:hypothetical protein [Nostoc sp. PCC 7524]AFY49378.1 hypothetical protein Nos7524_3587 [Nostoc sp. PCC 7524]
MKNLWSSAVAPSCLAATAVVMASSVFAPANAASLSFIIEEFTGSDARVQITLDDQIAGSGKVQFKVDYLPTGSNTIADLRGLFFNILDDSLLKDLKVTGANITASKFGPAGTIQSVGSSSNNLNGGGGKFDAGVEIGQQGIGGGDDFQTTTFTLYHTSKALTLEQFSQQNFGARLMSVGSQNGSRNGSSKLKGQAPYYTPPPPPPKKVPEPTAIAALGLFALSALKLSKKTENIYIH